MIAQLAETVIVLTLAVSAACLVACKVCTRSIRRGLSEAREILKSARKEI